MNLNNFVCLLIKFHIIKAEFYSTIKHGKYVDKEIVLNSTSPSVISCALKCRVFDNQTDAIFDKAKGICNCVKKSQKQSDDNQDAIHSPMTSDGVQEAGLARKQSDCSKEATLSGIFIKVKKTIPFVEKYSEWNRIVIRDEMKNIEKGYQEEKIIPKLTKEYIFSIDVQATLLFDELKNVMQMESDENTGDIMLPNINFNKKDQKIVVRTPEKDNKGEWIKFKKEGILEKNKWYNIKISQIKDNGNFLYTIELDGIIQHSIINHYAADVYQVKCFISLKDSQPGKTKNVWLDVRND